MKIVPLDVRDENQSKKKNVEKKNLVVVFELDEANVIAGFFYDLVV